MFKNFQYFSLAIIYFFLVPTAANAVVCVDGYSEVWFEIEFCNENDYCRKICLTEKAFSSEEAPIIVARFAEAFSLGRDSVEETLNIFAFKGGFKGNRKYDLDYLSLRSYCVQSVAGAENTAC